MVGGKWRVRALRGLVETSQSNAFKGTVIIFSVTTNPFEVVKRRAMSNKVVIKLKVVIEPVIKLKVNVFFKYIFLVFMIEVDCAISTCQTQKIRALNTKASDQNH